MISKTTWLFKIIYYYLFFNATNYSWTSYLASWSIFNTNLLNKLDSFYHFDDSYDSLKRKIWPMNSKMHLTHSNPMQSLLHHLWALARRYKHLASILEQTQGCWYKVSYYKVAQALVQLALVIFRIYQKVSTLRYLRLVRFWSSKKYNITSTRKTGIISV